MTTIRALLTPYPMKEMRIKGEYIHHESIKGAMGIKISAPLLENALPGSELWLAKTEDDIEECKERVESDLANIFSKYVDKTN